MFILKKTLYLECARTIVKELSKCAGGETNQKVLTLRLLVYHLHGKEGLDELDTYIRDYKKIYKSQLQTGQDS